MASRFWRTTRRLAVAGFALLLVLLTAGAVYQSLGVRAAAGRFSPPGTLVDVGGRRLHLLCIGAPQPAVPQWFSNPAELAVRSAEGARGSRGARPSLLVHRAGTGFSDPGSRRCPRSPAGVLDECSPARRFLVRTVVSSSIGGLTAELFWRAAIRIASRDWSFSMLPTARQSTGRRDRRLSPRYRPHLLGALGRTVPALEARRSDPLP